MAEMWTQNNVEYLLYYLYDENGAPIGLQYRTSNYASGVFDFFFFDKNLQGDVIGIYNADGEKICTYTYDAWGVCELNGVSGITLSAVENYVAVNNPFRYRGYYYDTETGLYYLQSRYYNPEWGRFLNADGITTIAATPNGLYDKNLFSYCDNNPITRADNGGDFWHIAIGAVVGAVAGFASSVITDFIKGEEIDLGAAAISAGIGAIEGGLSAAGVPIGAVVGVSAGLSAAESVYSDVKENICADGDNSVGDIIAHATINAGVSALFTAAGGQSNGREISRMYKAARSAKNSLKASGLHPTVKKSFNKAISTYSQEFRKFTKDCLLDACISTPFSTFSSEYTAAKYNYAFGGS